VGGGGGGTGTSLVSIVCAFSNFCPAGLKDVTLEMEIHSILKALFSEMDLAEIRFIRSSLKSEVQRFSEKSVCPPS
jgi:hypothetical protein